MQGLGRQDANADGAAFQLTAKKLKVIHVACIGGCTDASLLHVICQVGCGCRFAGQ